MYICSRFMEKKIRIGAVSYLNSKPLIYGLQHGPIADKIELILDYPSNLTSLLQKDKLDIALLPVASIHNIQDAEIISDYCIASKGKVASVCLFSHVPIEEIQSVYLDFQSRTSVALLRLLFRDYWNIRPSLLEGDEHYINHIQDKTAGLIIGDRALEQLNHFPFVYDLAEAWHDHTKMPFVFATWVSNKKLPASFLKAFNAANAEGFKHLDEIVQEANFKSYDLHTYFHSNISYHLDEENKNGLTLFQKSVEKN
jgi:chorismate dehydratase